MRRSPAVLLGIFAVCRGAHADPVKPEPSRAPSSVAPEQQSAAPNEEDTFSIRRPGQQPAEARPGPAKRWYGLPILIADGAAYILLATAISNEKSKTVTVPLSLPVYGLSGPVTHAANGHWGRAGISLLMRAGLPLAGAMLGASGCTRDSGDCASGIISLAVVGMAAASVIDVAALAWEPVETSTAASLRLSVAMGGDATWLGAGGSF
jgi:hypothetical protein